MTQKVKEKIRQYLTGPKPWEVGLDLYLKHGANQALKAIFQASGETAYNYQKLITELEKTVGGDGSPRDHIGSRPTGARPTPGIPVVTAKRPNPGVAVPDIYNPEAKKMFQERSLLHAQLLHLPTDEERKEHAFQILDLSEQVENCLTRALVTICEPSLPEDRGQLVKILNNNRAYISKNKQRPEKATEVEKRVLQNQKIENELLRVED